MVYVIILLTLVVIVVAAARSKNIVLRRIGAFSNMQLTVSEAVESGRAVHVSLGGAALHDRSSITAIAASEIAYHLIVRSAPGDKASFITLSDPVTLALAQDRLMRAYKIRNLMARYSSSLGRWYPSGPLSLAFAAGAGLAMLDEDASTNVLMGQFGPEMMLIAENALRADRFLIAHSDLISGQAIAYAVSDAPLIGEEMYAGAAYMERTPMNVGSVMAQDAFRYLIVAGLIVLAVLAFLGVNI